MTEQSFDKAIAVNFKGAYFTIQKALPLLRRGSSVIINGSVGARKGRPTTSTVSTCKAAVVHLAGILSAELVDGGICANTLSPGRQTRRCSVASQWKSRARRLRASSEPIIQASGWPIRWRSRSWELPRVGRFAYVVGDNFLIDGGVSSIRPGAAERRSESRGRPAGGVLEFGFQPAQEGGSNENEAGRFFGKDGPRSWGGRSQEYSAFDFTNDRIGGLERELEQLKDELRRTACPPEPRGRLRTKCAIPRNLK